MLRNVALDIVSRDEHKPPVWQFVRVHLSAEQLLCPASSGGWDTASEWAPTGGGRAGKHRTPVWPINKPARTTEPEVCAHLSVSHVCTMNSSEKWQDANITNYFLKNKTRHNHRYVSIRSEWIQIFSTVLHMGFWFQKQTRLPGDVLFL